MQTYETIKSLREALAKAKLENGGSGRPVSVGFMPTLGFIHEGHLSLIARARQECGIVVVSIFVNPLQFGQNEDFDKYPRDLERDLALCRDAGVDFVFAPSEAEMYPSPFKTKVTVAGITEVMCGASRPGHFDGVATVVAKLLNIVQPDRAYFGMKDAQQVAVIQQMADDLNMPVEIVPCPTLREADGLAMSSRNVYLNPEERKQALVLSQSLELAEQLLEEPGMTPQELIRRVKEQIRTAPLAVIDYVDLRTYPSLEPVTEKSQLDGSVPILLALAVKFGRTRLIDNRLFYDKRHKGV